MKVLSASIMIAAATLIAMWVYPAHEQRIAQLALFAVSIGAGRVLLTRALGRAPADPTGPRDPFARPPFKWRPHWAVGRSVVGGAVGNEPHDLVRLRTHVELALMSEFSAVSSLRPSIARLAEGRALDEAGAQAAARLLSITSVHDARRHGHGLSLAELDALVSGLERAGRFKRANPNLAGADNEERAPR